MSFVDPFQLFHGLMWLLCAIFRFIVAFLHFFIQENLCMFHHGLNVSYVTCNDIHLHDQKQICCFICYFGLLWLSCILSIQWLCHLQRNPPAWSKTNLLLLIDSSKPIWWLWRKDGKSFSLTSLSSLHYQS